jgi:hypothetical protein
VAGLVWLVLPRRGTQQRPGASKRSWAAALAGKWRSNRLVGVMHCQKGKRADVIVARGHEGFFLIPFIRCIGFPQMVTPSIRRRG